MGKRPNLTLIIEEFQKGGNFELTSQQYKNKTGAEIPKEKSYTEKKSAVAKLASDYGYTIHVIPQRIQFIKAREGE